VHAYKTPKDLAGYRAEGGCQLLADCLDAKRTREDIIKIVATPACAALVAPDFRLAASGRWWRGTRTAADGGQWRRGRARRSRTAITLNKIRIVSSKAC
jgi:hypothetical protein